MRVGRFPATPRNTRSHASIHSRHGRSAPAARSHLSRARLLGGRAPGFCPGHDGDGFFVLWPNDRKLVRWANRCVGLPK